MHEGTRRSDRLNVNRFFFWAKAAACGGSGPGAPPNTAVALLLLAGVAGAAAAAAARAAAAPSLAAAFVSAAPPRIELAAIGSLRLAVLRDDETALAGTDGLVRGNKARKFAALPTDRSLASYGGVQSNAAAALAALAAARGVPFRYYVRGAVPAHLAREPTGNYAALLARGATLVELERGALGYVALRAYGEGRRGALRPPFLPADALLVPQGGACGYARPGVAQLAAHVHARACATPAVRTVALVCAGTGASALFLALELHRLAGAAANGGGCGGDGCGGMVPVLALPCAMHADALRAELAELHARSALESDRGSLPLWVFTPPANSARAVRFGALEPEALRAWRRARAAGMRIDLLYGAPALAQLLRAEVAGGGGSGSGGVRAIVEQLLAERSGGAREARPLELLWVHTGGLEGVPSQLARYVRAGLATPDELALAQAEADISARGPVYGTP